MNFKESKKDMGRYEKREVNILTEVTRLKRIMVTKYTLRKSQGKAWGIGSLGKNVDDTI